jgi:hypothetical protein
VGPRAGPDNVEKRKFLTVIIINNNCRVDFMRVSLITVFFFFGCAAIGTAATPGLLCQPRVIVKMIVEKQMEYRLAGESGVLGENLPQRHFCPSQNPT